MASQRGLYVLATGVPPLGLSRQDLQCSPDVAFVVLDRGPFRQPLTQQRQRLSHGGEVFRRLLHFAPHRTTGQWLFSADRRNNRALLSILSSVFLGSSRAAMDGNYYPAGSYILWKVQKNQSVRCVCPRRGIEIEPDF